MAKTTKWVRISIALTRRELEMLKIVKEWGGMNAREMVQVLIGGVWNDIPKKYKKNLIGDDEEQKKKLKRRIIREVKRKKSHFFN